jgi:hypothetical protein
MLGGVVRLPDEASVVVAAEREVNASVQDSDAATCLEWDQC